MTLTPIAQKIIDTIKLNRISTTDLVTINTIFLCQCNEEGCLLLFWRTRCVVTEIILILLIPIQPPLSIGYATR